MTIVEGASKKKKKKKASKLLGMLENGMDNRDKRLSGARPGFSQGVGIFSMYSGQ